MPHAIRRHKRWSVMPPQLEYEGKLRGLAPRRLMRRPMVLYLLLVGALLMWAAWYFWPRVPTGERDTLWAASDPQQLDVFKQQTGLTIPASADVLGYFPGWDERFLKLRLPRADVGAFVASYPVEAVGTFPKMDGMGSIPAWWRPRDLTSFEAYDGQFRWKTGSLGGVSILVEGGGVSVPVVYVYVVKT